ncbi:MAG: InlB B-repeat-containing protein [Erysipelotrichaceae bacterium]|nr:InlB B-repeat-containing protein [Erysipelotrichaceae bacterium]
MNKTVKRIVLRILAVTVLVGIFSMSGISRVNAAGHSHEGWTPIDNDSNIPTEAGNYYLASDFTLGSDWTVPSGETNLCLNKNSILVSGTYKIIVGDRATLNIYDENGGFIRYNDSSAINDSYGIEISGGTVNIYGGTISNFTSAIFISAGTLTLGDEAGGPVIKGNHTGIQTNGENVSVTINNASITGNDAGIMINGSDKVVMNGGEIISDSKNSYDGAVLIGSGSASFTLNKGIISGANKSIKNNSLYIHPTIVIGDNASTANDVKVYGAIDFNSEEDKNVSFHGGYYDEAAYESLKDSYYLYTGYKFEDADGLKKIVKGSGNHTFSAVAYPYNMTNYVNVVKSVDRAPVNTLVTLTVNTGQGYAFHHLDLYTNPAKQPIEYKTDDGVHFTFIMPDEPVRADAYAKPYRTLEFDLLNCDVEIISNGKENNLNSNNRCIVFPNEPIELKFKSYHNTFPAYMIIEGIDLETGKDEYTFTMPDNNIKFTVAYLEKEHEHDGKDFLVWKDSSRLPPVPGSYALGTDVTITSNQYYSGGYDLCLNGHTILEKNGGITFMASDHLSLYDCQGSGVITGEGSGTELGIALGAANFNMYGGTITGFTTGLLGNSNYINIYKGTIEATTTAIDYDSGNGITIGSANDTEPQTYINGRVLFKSYKDVKLYSGYYDSRAESHLNYYGKDKFVRPENANKGFVETGRDDAYKYMIADKSPYTITFNGTNGSVSAKEGTSVVGGTKVNLILTPKDGYELESLTVQDSEGNKVTVSDDNSFTMPRSNVEVTASFKLATYKITYDLGGGTATNPESYTYESETFTLNNPTKENFSFLGWTGTDTPNPRTEVKIEQGSTGDRKYTANWEGEKYTITFKDGETVLQQTQVEYGETPKYNGTDPTKDSTAEYTYTFAGWDPEIAAVTRNETYTATYIATKNKYTITFVDEDGKELQSSEVEYGKTPSYTGEEPSKTADAQYTYAFAGWDPEITSVKGDTTYKATYSSTLNKYTITFVDEDGTKLQSSEVEYGTMPVYSGKEPAKEGYVFAGWDPSLNTVTGEATYKATYSEQVETYSAIWLNNDLKTVLHEQEDNKTMTEIDAITASIDTPVSALKSDQYDFTFLNWNTTTKDGVIQYIATFSQKPKTLTVTWKNGETVLKTDSVTYGGKPIYTGETPTKEASQEYTYVFKGWNPEVSFIKTNTDYTAVYTEVKNKYKITFTDDNGTILQTSEVEYGSTPEYKGETPTKSPIEGYVYEFKGWDPEIVSVTGNATYKATFVQRSNKVKVTFVNYDGETVLTTVETIYGEIPEYDGPVPTRNSADNDPYTYEFKGWDPELGNVTKDTKYTATYKEIPKKYKVTFDLNGADYGMAPDEMVTYDTLIPEPIDPSKEGFNFAGWFTKDDNKWNFDTPLKGAVDLVAQWIVVVEEPTEDGNKLEGQEVNNKYNENPLVIKTNNGVIYIPAGYKDTVAVPEISNEDNVITTSQDLSDLLNLESNEVTWIYLDVEYTKSIDETLTSEDSKQGYTEVSDSGFTADVRKFILKDNKETEVEDYKYPGSLILDIDLEGMGITLPEAAVDKIRTFYAGHNFSEKNVEYLQMVVSSDKKTASIRVSSLSPFCIVYKDVDRTKPSTPSYTPPKTGDK